MEKYCQRCMGTNPKEAKYCRQCGARFADWRDSVVKPKIVYRDRTKYIYKTPKWIYICLCALIIILWLTIWYCYRIEDSNYSGNKYLSKILGEKEFLRINGSDSIPTVLFQANDNGEFFQIQSNVRYHIEGLPKWCHITDSTSNSFKIIPYNNPAGEERVDTCYLVSKGKSIPIVLSQWGSCVAKFISLNVNYNSMHDDVSCIKFTIKFETFNMQRNQGFCALYFYNLDNEVLYSPDTRYASGNGQLSVGYFFMPRYIKTSFNDFTLFIPKSVFYQAAPNGRALVKVSLFDKFNDNFIKLTESQLYNIDAGLNYSNEKAD